MTFTAKTLAERTSAGQRQSVEVDGMYSAKQNYWIFIFISHWDPISAGV
jgi:hypothetical protein